MSGEATRGPALPTWVRAMISIGLVAGLLFLLDTQQISAALLQASPIILLAMLIVIYGERIYSALRWYQVLRWNGADVPLPVVIRISFISTFAGLFLPGALGAEALRVVNLARYGSGLARAFSSVLVDRLLTIITLMPFVLIGVALAPPGMPAGIQLTAWMLLLGVLFLLFLMLSPLPRRMLEHLLPSSLKPRLLPRLEALYASFDAYRRRPAMMLWAVALASGFQVLRIAVVWLAALAVGIEIAPAYFFIFAPVIVLLSLAPISFGGVGVREATFVYLFGLVGVAAEQAFAASVLVYIIGLVSCLPGAWLYARGTRTPPITQEVPLCARS